jgi:hypothetical protein
MECRRCGSRLDRAGDFCLVCRNPNVDTVVCEVGRERASVTGLFEGERVGTWTVTTVREKGENEQRERRNFAGRIADEIHRKRPEEVYATGERVVLKTLRAQLHYDLRRVVNPGEDVVERVLERSEESPLEVVETPPREKLGGSHSTLVGGRPGKAVIAIAADHPHVKKVIPGPIESGGRGSRTGVRAKATRAGTNGNVRLLVRDGSSVQEVRVVTTAADRTQGERVREDLNRALAEEGFRE